MFSPSSTNIYSLQAISIMESKQDQFYARGLSNSVAPSACLAIGSYDEHDPMYVHPDTSSPSRASRASRAIQKKVASGEVTTSYSDEERTLIGTPSGQLLMKKECVAP